MKVKKSTSIRLDKQSVGEIIKSYLLNKGVKVESMSFDMIDEQSGLKFLGVTVTAEEVVDL